MRFALIKNNRIVNIIEAPNEEFMESQYDETYQYRELEEGEIVVIEGEDSPNQNWEMLENALRNTSLWMKVFSAASMDLVCNTAFVLLYGTVTNTHNLDDFRFSIYQLKQSIGNTPIGPFTELDINQMATKLIECGFDPIDLGVVYP